MPFGTAPVDFSANASCISTGSPTNESREDVAYRAQQPKMGFRRPKAITSPELYCINPFHICKEL